MSLVLRYMTTQDIPQVVEIDRAAFSTPWSARSYSYEVSESTHSYMVVLEHTEVVYEPRGWRKLLGRFGLGNNHHSSPAPTIIAYGGLWRILEEAHVSTIASHPDWRRRGMGEIVLAAMIRRSLLLGAEYVVLEVRVSNTNAQNLYRKYGFETIGVKVNYYRDDNEDAYDMRLNIAEMRLSDFDKRFKELQKRYGFVDEYTHLPPPRERTPNYN